MKTGLAPELFFRADEHGFADQEEQQERRPGREEGRIGAEIAHRQREIVGDEIGEAEPHADHRANEQMARSGITVELR